MSLDEEIRLRQSERRYESRCRQSTLRSVAQCNAVLARSYEHPQSYEASIGKAEQGLQFLLEVTMLRLDENFTIPLTFQTVLPIRISDVNSHGHVDSALLVGLVGEAREQFFRERARHSTDNTMECIVILDDQVTYVSEAFYGEHVKVEMGISCAEGGVFELGWRMLEETTGREIAWGISGLKFRNSETDQLAK